MSLVSYFDNYTIMHASHTHLAPCVDIYFDFILVGMNDVTKKKYVIQNGREILISTALVNEKIDFASNVNISIVSSVNYINK